MVCGALSPETDMQMRAPEYGQTESEKTCFLGPARSAPQLLVGGAAPPKTGAVALRHIKTTTGEPNEGTIFVCTGIAPHYGDRRGAN